MSIDDQSLNDEFNAEHTKRGRHLSESQERKLATNLMLNLSQFEWYREQFTPAARMAHERALLETFAAQPRTPARINETD